MKCFLSKQGDYVVTIEKIDPSPESVTSCDLIIFQSNDSSVLYVSNPVVDFYGLNLYWGSNDISMIDKDVDEKVSSGDYFIIKSKDNGGIGRDGLRFTLKFNINDESMGHVRLDQGDVRYFSYTLPNLPNMEIHSNDQGNFSLDQSVPILDRFQSVDGQMVEFNLTIDYSGNESHNVTISLAENSEQFKVYVTNISTGGQLIISDSMLTELDQDYNIGNQNITIIIMDNQDNETLFSLTLYFTLTYGHKSASSFFLSIWQLIITVIMVDMLYYRNWNKPVGGRAGKRESTG